jgi:hypothetical protein
MPAFAGSISSPTSPFTWPGDSSGNPTTSVDITVNFPPAPGTQHSTVFLEECDGVSPTTPGWDPNIHCDNGTSPAGGVTDANGNFTFSHTDANHAFTPSKGTLPSGSFDCLSPHDPAPNDGLPQFRNCQIRASTNNGAVTTDQTFITIVLPDAGAVTPEVPLAIVLPISALVLGGGFFALKKRQDARAAARA